MEKLTFFWKTYLPKCCYSASYGILWTHIDIFSSQKLDFKIFIHSPIIKSMFSLYNLKKASYLRKMVGKLFFFFDKPAQNTYTQQWLK